MLLLLSARTWDDLLYRDEIIALAGRRDGFAAILRHHARGDAASRPLHAPSRPGRWSPSFSTRLPEPPKIVYVCGSNRFAEAGAEAALAAGIPRAAIRIERYGN